MPAPRRPSPPIPAYTPTTRGPSYVFGGRADLGPPRVTIPAVGEPQPDPKEHQGEGPTSADTGHETQDHAAVPSARGRRRPTGLTALGIFFALGALVAGLAALSLLHPGSVLEPMWRLNPRARAGFASRDGWAIPLLVLVSASCAGAAVGIWRGRPWGYWLSVGIFAVHLAGDVLNALLGVEPRALIGVPIVAALLVYLRREAVSASSGLTREAGWEPGRTARFRNTIRGRTWTE
jgi:hypothetical protein